MVTVLKGLLCREKAACYDARTQEEKIFRHGCGRCPLVHIRWSMGPGADCWEVVWKFVAIPSFAGKYIIMCEGWDTNFGWPVTWRNDLLINTHVFSVLIVCSAAPILEEEVLMIYKWASSLAVPINQPQTHTRFSDVFCKSEQCHIQYFLSQPTDMPFKTKKTILRELTEQRDTCNE